MKNNFKKYHKHNKHIDSLKPLFKTIIYKLLLN